MMEKESIDIDIYEDFKIHHNNITSLVTNSINIRSTHTVEFSYNDIKEIQTQAFRIKSESQVKFAHNYMHVVRKEAFTEIKPWLSEEAASIIFLENTIIQAEPLSCLLNMNYLEHERTIKDNRFKVLCNCNITDHFRTLLGINENSTHIQNATFKTFLAKTLCQESEEVSSRFINILEYIDTDCTAMNLAVVLSASIAVFLLLLVIVVSIVCHMKVKKVQEQANYVGDDCSTHSFSTSFTSPPLSPCYTTPQDFTKQIVVPEMKTYHQTEVYFPFENAEPISVSVRNSCLNQDLLADYLPPQQNRASCPFN
ncbi:unnamed protein product [Meganyctiphanes norvegica]|uniref:Envelope protein n=1 Tax=Meganyctiphanes norvegica TaxID=48144 RepID=A0AAV2RRH5_MEGNR